MYVFMYMYMSVHRYAYMFVYMCGGLSLNLELNGSARLAGQQASDRLLYSASPTLGLRVHDLCELGLELRSSGLCSKHFASCTISPTPASVALSLSHSVTQAVAQPGVAFLVLLPQPLESRNLQVCAIIPN